ncbi:MAG: hypothetical protein K2M12_03425 [Muribaculaceae bacterium]|nr:hypothetical protein [Muribaculaceae bacterium]
MKKLFLLAVICITALAAKAEIRYKSLNNIDGTNVVLVDEDAPDGVKVSDAVLYTDGHEYPAKEIRCDLKNGTATYKLKFKRLTTFIDPKVTLTINGRKVTVNLLQRQTLNKHHKNRMHRKSEQKLRRLRLLQLRQIDSTREKD